MEENTPKIISRKEAQAQGLKRYFTGKPCKHGHVAERYLKGGTCHTCSLSMGKASDAKRYKNSQSRRDMVKAAREGWKAANPEKVKSASTRNYLKNPAAYYQRAIQRQRDHQAEYEALSLNDQQRIDAIYREAKALIKRDGPNTWHVDHIHPVSKGGAHHPDNLQILTAKENLSKGAKLNLEER